MVDLVHTYTSGHILRARGHIQFIRFTSVRCASETVPLMTLSDISYQTCRISFFLFILFGPSPGCCSGCILHGLLVFAMETESLPQGTAPRRLKRLRMATPDIQTPVKIGADSDAESERDEQMLATGPEERAAVMPPPTPQQLLTMLAQRGFGTKLFMWGVIEGYRMMEQLNECKGAVQTMVGHTLVEGEADADRIAGIMSRIFLVLRGTRGTKGVPWVGGYIRQHLEDLEQRPHQFAQDLWQAFQRETCDHRGDRFTWASHIESHHTVL